MISPSIFYLVITGFIGAFKAYSDSVALFGTNLNAAGMNTIVGYVYDMLYGNSGGYPSYASAAAIILFGIVLLIVAFSVVLPHFEEDIATFPDALWYCFAIVTTIGFGDIAASTPVGRILSVILGLYGIAVVALITSIIVNFYGEMKSEDEE
jgi:hypothetical protein